MFSREYLLGIYFTGIYVIKSQIIIRCNVSDWSRSRAFVKKKDKPYANVVYGIKILLSIVGKRKTKNRS